MIDEFTPEIFLSNKWNILKEIAKEPQSPSDLALKTGTSLSNITQQLKLLEAYKIVKKEKSDEKNTGKPRTIYYLNGDVAYSIVLKEGKAERKAFEITENNQMFFNILFSMNPDDLMYILKFSFKYEEVLKKCKSIGFLKSTRDSIELFLITDHLDEIRSKFSNIFIEDLNGKTKKIINWSHNEFEINDGLNRKDKYFVDMIKNTQIIHDQNNVLKKIKDLREKA
jgi:DNA-binding HxlR family transcriptional regulator